MDVVNGKKMRERDGGGDQYKIGYSLAAVAGSKVPVYIYVD